MKAANYKWSQKPSVSCLAEREGGRVFFNPNFVIFSYIQAVRQMFPDEQLAKNLWLEIINQYLPLIYRVEKYIRA